MKSRFTAVVHTFHCHGMVSGQILARRYFATFSEAAAYLKKLKPEELNAPAETEARFEIYEDELLLSFGAWPLHEEPFEIFEHPEPLKPYIIKQTAQLDRLHQAIGKAFEAANWQQFRHLALAFPELVEAAQKELADAWRRALSRN